MDFSILPPEVISSLIWSGPGAGALQNASVAWTNLAEQIEQSSTDAGAVISGLGGVWKGSSSADMISSTQPYLAWLATTAEQARATGLAASAAAGAFELARSETVPPAVVTSNRSQFAYLIATNIFGQNAPAIAANETQYAAMWAQDAAAMNTYSASSSSATAQLPTFQPSPQVTNLSANPTPAAVTAAAAPAATTLEDILSGPLGQLFLATLSAGFPVDIVALFTAFFGPFLGSSMIAGNLAVQNEIIASKPSVPSVVYPPTSTAAKPEVKASVATGNRLGPMRVPPSWAQPQQPKLATPLAPEHRDTRDRLGLPVVPAVPVLGAGSRQTKKRPGYSDPDDMHYGKKSPPILNRHPSGG